MDAAGKVAVSLKFFAESKKYFISIISDDNAFIFSIQEQTPALPLPEDLVS